MRELGEFFIPWAKILTDSSPSSSYASSGRIPPTRETGSGILSNVRGGARADECCGVLGCKLGESADAPD